MANWYNEDVKELFDAILTLETREDCFAFFSDICTVTEIQSISQRLRVAELLRRGMSYNAITAKTGVSAATISRVSRCLEYGEGGYDLVMERMEEPGEK